MAFWKSQNTLGHEPKKGQPATYVLAVREYVQKYPLASLKIYRRGASGGSGGVDLGMSAVETYPLAAIADMAPQMENWLKNQHGGGHYSLQITDDTTGQNVAVYGMSIEGRPIIRGAGGKEVSGDGGAAGSGGSKSGSVSDMKAMAETLVILAKIGGDKNSGDKDFTQQMNLQLLNRLLEASEDSVEKFAKVVQLVDSIRPQVNKDEGTVAAALNAVPSFISAWAAMKAGGPQAVAALAGAGAAQAVEPPKATPLPPGQQEPAQEQEEPFGILDALVQHLQIDMQADASAKTVADRLFAMIKLADTMKAEHHPLIDPFLADRDPASLMTAFEGFCAGIPELKVRPAFCAEVRQYLVNMVVGLAPEQQPEERGPEEPAGQQEVADDLDHENPIVGGEENVITIPGMVGEDSPERQSVNDGAESGGADGHNNAQDAVSESG